MASVFEGIFKEYALGYVHRVPAYADTGEGESEGEGEQGERLRDSAGNFAFINEPRILRVFLRSSSPGTARLIRDQYGADDKSVAITGRCIEPVEIPAELLTGDLVSVTIDNRPGALRIVRAVPSPLEIITELLGQRFDGIWRPA